MKRSLGAVFQNNADSHRDILVSWRTPYGAAVRTFFGVAPLPFVASSGLCALAGLPLGKPLDGEEIGRPDKRLMAEGIQHIYVLGGADAYHESGSDRVALEDMDLLDPSTDALAVNRMASGTAPIPGG
jgi:hypothetical protein